jgi:hypothetical protein
VTTRDLKKRIATLEARSARSSDTFLAELSDEQLVNLALDLSALDEQAEAPPSWPEWLDKPSEEEREAIHQRFRALERQRGGREASARTATRDLLVVALLDTSGAPSGADTHHNIRQN